MAMLDPYAPVYTFKDVNINEASERIILKKNGIEHLPLKLTKLVIVYNSETGKDYQYLLAFKIKITIKKFFKTYEEYIDISNEINRIYHNMYIYDPFSYIYPFGYILIDKNMNIINKKKLLKLTELIKNKKFFSRKHAEKFLSRIKEF